MKTKLLVIADTYYPKVDGILRFMEEFTKRAQDQFAVSLLVPELAKKKKKLVDNINYIKPSNLLNISGYPSMKLSFKNFKKMKEAIRNVDLVFIQGPALISYFSIYYAHKYKKKVVFYMHVITWELFAKFLPSIINKLFFKIFKKISIILYNKCDEILLPYYKLKEQLKSAGIKTRMTTAKLGVDINRFSPAKDKRLAKEKIGIKNNKFVVGYVGRISKEKNVKILLEAFQKLGQQENLHLLIVGDGPTEQKELLKKVRNCNITGFVSNVQDYLKAMDIFVMPSLTETTSLATLEAMSCGLAVIVSKVGFMKEYIIRDHSGIFFPKNKSTMLALKIEKLRQEKDFRLKLGKNARRTVAYSFSWERSINKIKKILFKQDQQLK